MDSFLFSINSSLPIVLLVAMGVLFRKFNLIKAEALPFLDRFVFRVALPFLMFANISTMDFYSEFSLTFMLYCILATLASFLIIWYLSLKFFPDRPMAGSFAQGSVRASIGMLSVAIVSGIYGSAGIAALMIAFAVPFYNILSVVILTSCGSTDNKDPNQLKNALKGIVTNPMILGIAAGLPFALLRIDLPHIITKPISDLGACATTVGLISMGASFNFADATSRFKPALAATAIKLVILPVIGLPIAVYLGFRGAALCSLMLMLGSATAPPSYIMAKEMGCDAPLASNIVILTQTLFAVTLTFWLFLLRSMTLI